MGEYKPANVEALAQAMYQRECDYVGADHGGYCVAENIKTLQSFESEIERLTAELAEVREGTGSYIRSLKKQLGEAKALAAVDKEQSK